MKFIDIASDFAEEYINEFKDIILKLKKRIPAIEFDVDMKDHGISISGKRLVGSVGFTLKQISDKDIEGDLYAFCQKGIWVYLAKDEHFSHLTTDELVNEFVNWAP